MFLSGPKPGSQQGLDLGWKPFITVEMEPWKPLDQEPVLAVDETLVCSVVQEGGSILIVDAYKSQPHARDRIK